jgi:propanol-preferring alcohol dehydrogenase
MKAERRDDPGWASSGASALSAASGTCFADSAGAPGRYRGRPNRVTMQSMQAMVFDGVGHPLRLAGIPTPVPGPGEVRLRVLACGVCRTDLHILDGELPEPRLPLVLGHQIVGIVDVVGTGVREIEIGERVGVPWLGKTCGACAFCLGDRENLCDTPKFTGYDVNGGFAEYTVADARYCFKLPIGMGDVALAPLLCAGLIGYRALRLAGNPARLGIYGFGAAAHLVTQIARYENRKVFAFTRRGDTAAQDFARSLGAAWASGSDEPPPVLLDAAIVFAAAGELVPAALAAVQKGGVVVCGGIHMSDIPSLPYSLLWGERTLRSVANLTRADGVEFLELSQRARVHTEVSVYPLERTEQALGDLRLGRFTGAAVVQIAQR